MRFGHNRCDTSVCDTCISNMSQNAVWNGNGRNETRTLPAVPVTADYGTERPFQFPSPEKSPERDMTGVGSGDALVCIASS